MPHPTRAEGKKVKFSRIWAMPDSETFKIEPIRQFVESYMRKSKRSFDPFSRNCQMATQTNDLSPDTVAQNHMKAKDFIGQLDGLFDLCIYDPPYSSRQISECYQSVGLPVTMKDTQNGSERKIEKDLIEKHIDVGGYFLQFGWHTNGMGRSRGFEIEEILIVPHGGVHNDTICMAERRITKQENLL